MIRFFKQKNMTKMWMITVCNQFHSIIYIVFPNCLGALMYLNEATLLNNVRRRYKKDLIYV